ncbi:1026_t:CDS:2 [Paraglomus occultum]|uniref:Translocation protein SEC62 n=1 Tax=Paraglomus occultum TaxID=144539 RepID=A0A9N9BIZ2_9GLOM|nr:1026_t:CDS:2 [Paraglomus occultum]
MEKQREASPEFLNVIKYLRSRSSGMSTREGILNGKRVEYFKGKSAVRALLKDSYKKLKNVPPVADATDANKLLQEIHTYAFFLSADRSEVSGRNTTRLLQINHHQMWSEEKYYVWFYEGSQLLILLGGISLVSAVFAAVLFPLWPPLLRNGVWYISVAILGLFGLFILLAIVRLIFFILTMLLVSPGIWIFPNLFADVGFVDSFIPLWGWEVTKKKPSVEGENVEGMDQTQKDLRATEECELLASMQKTFIANIDEMI